MGQGLNVHMAIYGSMLSYYCVGSSAGELCTQNNLTSSTIIPLLDYQKNPFCKISVSFIAENEKPKLIEKKFK